MKHLSDVFLRGIYSVSAQDIPFAHDVLSGTIIKVVGGESQHDHELWIAQHGLWYVWDVETGEILQ